MPATSPLDLIRPFLWIAAVGFLLGFAGYALMGPRGSIQPQAGPAGVWSPAVQTAPPAGDGPVIIA